MLSVYQSNFSLETNEVVTAIFNKYMYCEEVIVWMKYLPKFYKH